MHDSKPAGDRTWVVDEVDANMRLDKYLAAPGRVGSRGRAAAALDHGKVFLNGGELSAGSAGVRVRPGDVIRLWLDRPGSGSRPARRAGELDIVFDDKVLIVVNKPPGILSVPLERRGSATSVYDQIHQYVRSHGKRRPFVVHRIDRDTSGVVLFAKTASIQAALKAQFRRREPERVYLAVVYGHPSPAEGTWRDHLVWDRRFLIQKETHPGDPRGTEAVAEYRIVERFATTSLIEVRLHTGKRNQIRVQARLRGHTLVGERRYVYGPETLRPIQFPRQALHAYRLAFRHPVDGRTMRFEAPVPEDLRELIARLRDRLAHVFTLLC